MAAFKVKIHHIEVCCVCTCFHVQVQLVSVRVEGPAHLQFYLESLPSADD